MTRSQLVLTAAMVLLVVAPVESLAAPGDHPMSGMIQRLQVEPRLVALPVGKATVSIEGYGTCSLSLAFGDGAAVSLNKIALPYTTTYHYRRPGDFIATATGFGDYIDNCGGKVSAPVSVTSPPGPPPLEGIGPRTNLDRPKTPAVPPPLESVEPQPRRTPR